MATPAYQNADETRKAAMIEQAITATMHKRYIQGKSKEYLEKELGFGTNGGMFAMEDDGHPAWEDDDSDANEHDDPNEHHDPNDEANQREDKGKEIEDAEFKRTQIAILQEISKLKMIALLEKLTKSKGKED
ncbi:hypothetical protein GLAREA_09893 [Glarea lozoyensis ATCC 20868]|uniref:Uncharacterized protein n=2 Tax=Glarea lozoyensis TaxID=101852 RepID=S3CQR9_GLAL2|nr:uncharacterized protein GLAREA_09893 [Glarea lozoyensis ATCC 20868]EHK97139.1 hypothetical protein M7I_7151 [Glarea lozoyensis 74030]EPE28772.1 hypothetical protein GLAREA_09893 [Glarea lozoyensis ATCC 20868]